MNVSRSGYYKWLSRKGKFNNYQINRKQLSEEIVAMHAKHKTWGYRAIANNIRNKIGWYFSDNLCHKCCKTLNIRSKARKTWAPRGKESIIYPNIVLGAWECFKPFQIITTDTTTFHTKGCVWDLTLYVDAFNNEIVGYDLDYSKHGASVPNHTRALQSMLQNKIKRGYIDSATTLHSDQGVIYSSRAFANAHKNYNINRSMSRAGTPTDNPVIESLNGWIKEELIIDFNLYYSEDVHKTIDEYITYYNNERLSSSLDYKSPVQYRTELGFK